MPLTGQGKRQLLWKRADRSARESEMPCVSCTNVCSARACRGSAMPTIVTPDAVGSHKTTLTHRELRLDSTQLVLVVSDVTATSAIRVGSRCAMRVKLHTLLSHVLLQVLARSHAAIDRWRLLVSSESVVIDCCFDTKCCKRCTSVADGPDTTTVDKRSTLLSVQLSYKLHTRRDHSEDTALRRPPADQGGYHRGLETRAVTARS